MKDPDAYYKRNLMRRLTMPDIAALDGISTALRRLDEVGTQARADAEAREAARIAILMKDAEAIEVFLWLLGVEIRQWPPEFQLDAHGTGDNPHVFLPYEPPPLLPKQPATLHGVGSPEGVVTAPAGSLFLRTDGGSDSGLTPSIYYKEIGADSTGWAGIGRSAPTTPTEPRKRCPCGMFEHVWKAREAATRGFASKFTRSDGGKPTISLDRDGNGTVYFPPGEYNIGGEDDAGGAR